MRGRAAKDHRNGSDRRAGPGIGSLILVAALLLFAFCLLSGRRPQDLLHDLLSKYGAHARTPPSAAAVDAPAPIGDETAFLRATVAENNQVWATLFEKAGQRYPAPRLVLYSAPVQTGCNGAALAAGPYYCPGDRTLYLDLAFFDAIRARLGGGGEFAQAYVVAHEVAHHVQNLFGITGRIEAMARHGKDPGGAAGLSVRLELQADCYAGVWAALARPAHRWLAPGDITLALGTASTVGDDRLRPVAGGLAESFNHGSAELRARWFRTGFESGSLRACDTFRPPSL